jgi:hypothetical protein
MLMPLNQINYKQKTNIKNYFKPIIKKIWRFKVIVKLISIFKV